MDSFKDRASNGQNDRASNQRGKAHRKKGGAKILEKMADDPKEEVNGPIEGEAALKNEEGGGGENVLKGETIGYAGAKVGETRCSDDTHSLASATEESCGSNIPAEEDRWGSLQGSGHTEGLVDSASLPLHSAVEMEQAQVYSGGAAQVDLHRESDPESSSPQSSLDSSHAIGVALSPGAEAKHGVTGQDNSRLSSAAPEGTNVDSQPPRANKLEMEEGLTLDNDQPPRLQDDGVERVPVVVAFGVNNSWFIRWSDGSCSWDGLPETLHEKLKNRDPKLPGIKHLSLSETEEWFASFDDGSFAITDSCRGAILNAIQGGEDDDADVNQLVFCPNGGFVVTRDNGAISSERIPITLMQVISEYQESSVDIEEIAISKIGGWFVLFSDSECRWQDLPPRLEAILSRLIRKDPSSIILAFSPTEASVYFISFGSFYSTTFKNQGFLDAVDWAAGKSDKTPKVLTSTPPIKVESYTSVYGQFFDSLRNIECESVSGSPNINSPRHLRSSTNSDVARSPSRNTIEINPASSPLVDGMDAADARPPLSNHADYSNPSLELRLQQDKAVKNGHRSQMFSSILSSVTSMFGAKVPAPSVQNARKSLIYDRTLMSDKLNSILANLKIRYNSLDPHDINKDACMRMSSHLTELILQVSSADTHESLSALAGDSEFFSLYADGWLEATSRNPVPSPWLDGWFQGRFGRDREDIERIVKTFDLMQDSKVEPNTIEQMVSDSASPRPLATEDTQ